MHFLQINLLSSSKTSREVYSAKHCSKSFIFPGKGSVINLVHICGLKSFKSSCSSLGSSALLASEYFLGSKQSSHSSGSGTETSTNGSTSWAGYGKTIYTYQWQESYYTCIHA